ncbi:MAG: DUF58 domain-containing protein [Bradymonadia bacterium]
MPLEGRQPRLTTAGLSLTATSVCLLFISGVSGHVLPGALGAMMLGLIAWAVLWSTNAAQRARSLRITLDAESRRRPIRGRPWDLTLDLDATAVSRPLGTLELELMGAGFTGDARWPCPLDAQGRATTSVPLVFPQIGHWRLHGVLITLVDPLGLTTLSQYRPHEVAVTVRPEAVASKRVGQMLRPVGARRSREGRHLNRMRGHGLEIRELTHYTPGDPLKHIAWKASARRDDLLVRVFEEETQRHLQLLVDIGPSMRAGEVGASPLDLALDACTHLLLTCDRDRLGVTTYDTRVYGHLRPGRGAVHRQRLQQHLLDLTGVIDEDLTEITDAELLARVGAFIERQQGAFLRQHAEEANRPQIARSMADPLREIYDEAAVFAEVTRYLAEDRDRGHATLFAKARPAMDLLSARLRLFCALRGIPLPYRITGGASDRGVGLKAAISQNLKPGAAETLIIFTDLRGFDPDNGVFKALRLARSHRKHVIVIHPGGPAPSAEVRDALSKVGVPLLM